MQRSSSVPVNRLEWALADAVSQLGIGGWVQAEDILAYLNPITPTDFANLAYASDQLGSGDLPSEYAKDASRLKKLIESECYEQTKPHFKDLVALYERHFPGQVSVCFDG